MYCPSNKPGVRPNGRVGVYQHGVVTRTQWPFQPRVVETQDIDGRPTDVGQATNEEIAMHEDKVLRPKVLPGIEETHGAPAGIVRDFLAFVFIAELTGLCEVVDVIMSAPPTHRTHD